MLLYQNVRSVNTGKNSKRPQKPIYSKKKSFINAFAAKLERSIPKIKPRNFCNEKCKKKCIRVFIKVIHDNES